MDTQLHSELITTRWLLIAKLQNQVFRESLHFQKCFNYKCDLEAWIHNNTLSEGTHHSIQLCVHVPVCACKCAHVHMSRYTCMCAHVFVVEYTSTHIYMCMCAHVHVCTRVYVSAHTQQIVFHSEWYYDLSIDYSYRKKTVT